MIADAEPIAFSPNAYKSALRPVWCPGCGDYGVLSSFYKAVADLKIPREQIVIASGIGCSGRFPAYVHAYGLHGTHGRALPLAIGVKMARPELVVVAAAGDGDAFSIGMGHFPHAARRNVDITYIVMDNEIYGLTKGQPSPTSPAGMEKKASPYGTVEAPIDPVPLAISCGASFVARGFAGDPKGLTELMKKALMHKGFSFIQVLSSCVTFNNTRDYFKEITAPLPAQHDAGDRMKAMAFAMSAEKMYLGVFYHQVRPTYNEQLSGVARENAKPEYGVREIMQRYMR